MATEPMAENLTTVIVDDEPLARQELRYLLEAAGGVDVLAEASNGVEALNLIRDLEPEVVFLDVRMPGLDGFSVLKKMLSLERSGRPPQVVFATAFDRYAVKAFEVNAVDYLLKPFDAKRLVKTLEKVRERLAISAEGAEAAGETGEGLASLGAGAAAKLEALLRMVEVSGAAAPARSGRVVMRAGGRMLVIHQDEVCFAAIDNGIITVVTRSGKGDSNCRTLEELAEQLDPELFWRPHRSFLVNIQHIREVMPWFNSSFQLKMDDKEATEVPVSRSQTKRLRELFKL
jgi:two-component system response regulator LytT